MFLVVFVVAVFVFSRPLFLFASLMESPEKAGFFLEHLISLFVSLYMLKVQIRHIMLRTRDFSLGKNNLKTYKSSV